VVEVSTHLLTRAALARVRLGAILERHFAGDDDLIGIVQRAVGYSLTGSRSCRGRASSFEGSGKE
jgi:hypothetical protein